jgi:hypothetical protein
MQGKKKVEEKTEVEDMLYVIGYPYDSDDELYAVNRLWDAHARRTIVFNGNIDGARGFSRVRCGADGMAGATRCETVVGSG